LYAKQGKISLAISEISQAIKLSPADYSLIITLARLYDESGDRYNAGLWQKRAMGLRPIYYQSYTRNNYLKLKTILDRRNIKLVCVEYPMRDIGELKEIFGGGGVIFVDNEKAFKDAVAKYGYNELFTDAFGGDFGHCTAKGYRLLAENVAQAVMRYYKRPTKLP
jgi:hypothetical protein